MKKDQTNKMIFGVCSGLANEYKVDVGVVRTVFAITALLGFGLPVVVYLVLAIVMPNE